MRLTLAVASLAALACLTPAPGAARAAPTGGAASGPYRLEVVDEAGRALPTFVHRGRHWVLGALGQRYLLRVRNDGPGRVEAVVSVDGRDVVDGEPASSARRGYLVEPGAELTIDGFRISTEAVAAFRFASVPRSYAALTGDARDVGVVGVAVFTERARPRPHRDELAREPRAKAERGAPRDGGEAPAPASAPAPEGAPSAARSGRAAERPGLGTEFGEEHASRVRLVSFERASSRPDALLTVRYDAREGLLAAGVDVDGDRWARRDEARRRDGADPFRGDRFASPPPGWRGSR
jgi:hypothetical protein